MDTNQHQASIEKTVDKKKYEEENESLAATAAKEKSLTSSPATASAASPPSASSSPSHEFSFTISLHSSSSITTTVPGNSNNKTKTTPPSCAVDLSPADEIFFHGHLLPLHLLSHLPVSPRSSTNSLDSFTLPIEDLIDDQNPENKFSNSISSNNSNSNNNSSNNIETCDYHHQQMNNLDQTKGRAKSRSFSLFGFTKWRKGYEVREHEDWNKDQKQKKKLRFDVSQVIKKYVRMVRPLLLFRGRRENGHHFQRQPYSFSGNLSFRNKQEPLIRRGRRGEFSAPASIRTSPTNSGLLVATTNISSSTSDSTMEELQAAIQAAIAHCKNSIAAGEKLKC